MLVNSYHEQIFFHYVLNNQQLLEIVTNNFFGDNIMNKLFSIAKPHAQKYKSAPTYEQVYELLKVEELDTEINSDILRTIYDTKDKLPQFDSVWLDENVESWTRLRNLDIVVRNILTYMKTNNVVEPSEVSSHIEKIRNLLISGTNLDFKFELGADFFNPDKHTQERLDKRPTGYKYIDTCLSSGTKGVGGGWWNGSLIVFLSGPKAGKSLWLQNLAEKSCLNGQNTAYISLELQEELINMRIGSNMFNVPINDYEDWAKDKIAVKEKINKVKRNAEDSLKSIGVLHVKEFGASTCSVSDMTNYLKKTQDILGIKFENVFVDYINILKNSRNANSENTYMKIKQICEDLRATAMENNWCIISATQTNRAGWDTSDLNITDISESAALLHTVDMLFGIITNTEYKAQNMYYLKCMASRISGYENTKKKFDVDWKYARIKEDSTSEILDCNIALPDNNTNYKRNQFSNNRNNNIEVSDIQSLNTSMDLTDIQYISKDLMNNTITGSTIFGQ